MSIWEAMAWFWSTFLGILLIFERVEKFSSKHDLEQYYLLLTVHPSKVSRPLHSAVSAFFDKIFGVGPRFGPIHSPSILRILIYSFATTMFAVWVFNDRVKQFILVFFLAFISGVFFDYLSFSKTRTIIDRLSSSSGFLRYVIAIAADAFGLFLLMYCSVRMFVLLQYLSIEVIPQITAWVLRIQPVVEGGEINWDETFYRNGLQGTPLFSVQFLYVMFSASISTLIFLVFVFSAFVSSLRDRIPFMQRFIDNHTSAQEKPLQVIGLLAGIGYGVVYWVGYGLACVLPN